MIGIRSIASYVPPAGIDNVIQGQAFGESKDFLQNRIGALLLPRKDVGEETSDMAAGAMRNLMNQTGLQSGQIEALVLVTQNGDGCGLPHTSAIVHEKIGLPKHIPVFDISLGCSGYVYGLSILQNFLKGSGLKNGILITADPYSKIIDSNDHDTALLFGDAATVTWVGEGSEWEMSPSLYYTDGSGSKNLWVEEGILKMNGRQVFGFAVTQVPKHIKSLLEKMNMKDKDIDLFCLHQGSAAIVEAISKKFPLVKERFILDMKYTGNTVSSSIPLLLEKYLDHRKINRILLSGFGVGLSLATTIIQRRRTTC
jgi:3-oxoacyl-[acyl-carrier-protein] synthase-3